LSEEWKTDRWRLETEVAGQNVDRFSILLRRAEGEKILERRRKKDSVFYKEPLGGLSSASSGSRPEQQVEAGPFGGRASLRRFASLPVLPLGTSGQRRATRVRVNPFALRDGPLELAFGGKGNERSPGFNTLPSRGCQIFLGATYQNGKKCTKRTQRYQKVIK
jgi:hypothetical protein